MNSAAASATHSTDAGVFHGHSDANRTAAAAAAAAAAGSSSSSSGGGSSSSGSGGGSVFVDCSLGVGGGSGDVATAAAAAAVPNSGAFTTTLVVPSHHASVPSQDTLSTAFELLKSAYDLQQLTVKGQSKCA